MNLKTKDDSVNVWGLNREINAAVKVAYFIWHRHGQELMVTSARDGSHMPGSKHYCGDAVDLRTSYFGNEQTLAVWRELSDALGKDYDVVLHPTHIHVEWDPKGGVKCAS